MKYLLLIILLLLPTLSNASDWDEYQKYGTHGIKWDDYVRAGMGAFDSGNLAASEMFFQRAIARGAGDGLIFAKIGLYYEAQGNYKKALSYLKKAADKLPVQYPRHEYTRLIYEMQGRVLFMLDKKDEAIPFLKKGAGNKENFTSLYLLGQIANEKGETDNAIRYFEKALVSPHPQGLDPRIDVLVMIELGKAYFNKKDFVSSLAWWNKILEKEPGHPIATSYKAEIEKQKNKEEEKKMLERIVQ